MVSSNHYFVKHVGKRNPALQLLTITYVMIIRRINKVELSVFLRNGQLAERRIRIMGCGRLILAIILPPLAVLDKGCGAILVVTLLTIMGWIPGIIGAFVLASMDPRD